MEERDEGGDLRPEEVKSSVFSVQWFSKGGKEGRGPRIGRMNGKEVGKG